MYGPKQVNTRPTAPPMVISAGSRVPSRDPGLSSGPSQAVKPMNGSVIPPKGSATSGNVSVSLPVGPTPSGNASTEDDGMDVDNSEEASKKASKKKSKHGNPVPYH